MLSACFKHCPLTKIPEVTFEAVRGVADDSANMSFEKKGKERALRRYEAEEQSRHTHMCDVRTTALVPDEFEEVIRRATLMDVPARAVRLEVYLEVCKDEIASYIAEDEVAEIRRHLLHFDAAGATRTELLTTLELLEDILSVYDENVLPNLANVGSIDAIDTPEYLTGLRDPDDCLIRILDLLSTIHARLGNTVKQRDLLERVLHILEAALGPEHVQV